MKKTKKDSKSPDSLNILFADDEQKIRRMLSAEVTRMGHKVTVCPSGEAAVDALKESTYDCLLVDLDMPGMNGIEVIREAMDLAPETEAIVLTGKGSMKTANEPRRTASSPWKPLPSTKTPA